MKPLCIDLYCGLGGWAEGFLAEGFDVIGYDIERHDYGTGGYPGDLRIKDVLDITADEIRELNPRVIVASPPCTEPSYRAMPWKRAKALNATGPPWKFIELFEACFALSAETGVPLVVENVKGAQPWVGYAKAHFGSYYLWGDVAHCGNRIVAGRPLRMDRAIKAMRAQKVPGFRFDGGGKSFQSASVKAIKNNGGSWFAVANNTESGHSQNPVNEGVKQQIPGNQGWFGKYKAGCQGTRNYSSKSDSRKAASAMIAKIPFPLASHIARCFA